MARLLLAVLGEQYEPKIKTALGLNEIARRRRQRVYCTGCGNLLRCQTKTGLCRQCRHKSTQIEVACSQCNTLFEIRAASLIWFINHKNRQHHFCSKRCWGQWAGEHYGFRAHPENMKYRLKG